MNTRDLLARNFFHIESYDCVLCNEGEPENFQHLLFECDFSRNFWGKLNLEWNNDLSLIELLIDGTNGNNFLGSKEVLISGCWSLWNHRNKIIFDHQDLDIHECFRYF